MITPPPDTMTLNIAVLKLGRGIEAFLRPVAADDALRARDWQSISP
jgi:hypothetical protein